MRAAASLLFPVRAAAAAENTLFVPDGVGATDVQRESGIRVGRVSTQARPESRRVTMAKPFIGGCRVRCATCLLVSVCFAVSSRLALLSFSGESCNHPITITRFAESQLYRSERLLNASTRGPLVRLVSPMRRFAPILACFAARAFAVCAPRRDRELECPFTDVSEAAQVPCSKSKCAYGKSYILLFYTMTPDEDKFSSARHWVTRVRDVFFDL